MDISQNTTFTTTENIAWRNVNNEIVILNLKSGEYYTLNDVGQIIWLEVANQKSVEEIKSKLILEFDVSPDTAAQDIKTFISKMVDEGLLHVSANNQQAEGGPDERNK